MKSVIPAWRFCGSASLLVLISFSDVITIWFRPEKQYFKELFLTATTVMKYIGLI